MGRREIPLRPVIAVRACHTGNFHSRFAGPTVTPPVPLSWSEPSLGSSFNFHLVFRSSHRKHPSSKIPSQQRLVAARSRTFENKYARLSSSAVRRSRRRCHHKVDFCIGCSPLGSSRPSWDTNLSRLDIALGPLTSREAIMETACLENRISASNIRVLQRPSGSRSIFAHYGHRTKTDDMLLPG